MHLPRVSQEERLEFSVFLSGIKTSSGTDQSDEKQTAVSTHKPLSAAEAEVWLSLGAGTEQQPLRAAQLSRRGTLSVPAFPRHC